MKLLKFFSYLIILFLLITIVSCSDNEERVINVAIFSEDTTMELSLEKYKVKSYDIDNISAIDTTNIWVTYSFLKKKGNAESLFPLLDKGFNILIQEPNIRV